MSTKPRVAVVQAAPVAFELDATLAAYWEAAIDIPGAAARASEIYLAVGVIERD